MPVITFNLNGNPVSVDADSDEELLWVLRDRLDVHGLKYGCGMGLCGACTSHIDGVARRTCITPVREGMKVKAQAEFEKSTALKSLQSGAQVIGPAARASEH